mmetsp:Transcript_89340/g.255873  ORF Transcript_89340/g.255873 Transcript_89340/m.255873 type:complete len:227 (+) Transcript_89340:943-1623(+)
MRLLEPQIQRLLRAVAGAVHGGGGGPPLPTTAGEHHQSTSYRFLHDSPWRHEVLLPKTVQQLQILECMIGCRPTFRQQLADTSVDGDDQSSVREHMLFQVLLQLRSRLLHVPDALATSEHCIELGAQSFGDRRLAHMLLKADRLATARGPTFRRASAMELQRWVLPMRALLDQPCRIADQGPRIVEVVFLRASRAHPACSKHHRPRGGLRDSNILRRGTVGNAAEA